MARAITALLWTLVFLLSPAGTASARAVVANKTDGYEDRLANRSYQSERPTHILGCDSRTRPSKRTSPGTYGRIVVDGGVATSSGDRQIGVKDPTTGRTTGWFYNTIHQLEYIVEHIPGVTAASDILSVLPATQDYKTKYVYYTSGTGKGRVSEVHDAEGQTTLYTYTAKGQVATVRGTGQKPVDYIYDSAYGDLLELRTYYTFPGTYLKRTWQYEAASGLLRAKTGNSLSSKEEFEYYPSGALKVRENVRNARVTYTYTAYGDLKKIDYPDTATPDVTYTAHYRSGRPKTITDGAGTKTLTYDLASGGVTGETYTSGLLNGASVSRGFSSGRLNTLSASWSGATIPGLTHTYSTITGLHDAITRTGTTIKAAYRYRSSSAQVTERIFTNGGGERLRTILDFNPQNQLRAISNQRGGRAFSSHVYRVMDKLHRRKIVDREDGTQWHYAYNTEGELIKAGKYRNATEPLAGYQFRFTFDDASNREQRSRGGNATEGGGLITESYSTSTSDDIADQYSQVTHSPAFDILGQAGNPASVTVTTDISGTTTEQVDQSPWWRQRLTHTSSSSPRWGEATVSHALDSRTGDYYLPPGTETLSYDADGNLSGDARWTYTWDNQNRLIKMETKSAVITAGAPNDVLEFTYDGVNRRVRKKFIRNGSTVYDEYYLYDGWNITGRFRGSSVTKTLIQKYAWGLDASGTLHGAGGVGGLLWVEDGPTTTTRWFPAYDGNGNVMALLEDNANSATAGYLNLFHEYGPFGESLSKRGVMDSFGHNCPFQFSTKWTDEETGLIYYGHRYYDPKHGRWLSRDPIGEAGGVNLYGFVGNDGVNNVDILGREVLPVGQLDFTKLAPFSNAPAPAPSPAGNPAPGRVPGGAPNPAAAGTAMLPGLAAGMTSSVTAHGIRQLDFLIMIGLVPKDKRKELINKIRNRRSTGAASITRAQIPAVQRILDSAINETLANIPTAQALINEKGKLKNDKTVARLGTDFNPNDRELKLKPPGISVLLGVNAIEAHIQFRVVFEKNKKRFKKLLPQLGTISVSTVKLVKRAGFDVIADSTANFGNHGRIICTKASSWSNPTDINRLSRVFTTIRVVE